MIRLIEILENRILLQRRSKEERQKVYHIAKKRQIEAESLKAVKMVQDYQQNGSKGELDLRELQITQLPDNLTVRGNLVLIETQIAVLPKNLKVEGGLWLTRTPITQLPDNFKVGGSLFISDTGIKALPKDLQVEEDLYIGNTPIARKYSEEQIRQMVPGVKGDIFK